MTEVQPNAGSDVPTTLDCEPHDRMIARYRHPWAFFGVSFLGSTGLWFVAGRLSRIDPMSGSTRLVFSLTLLGGLVFPFVTAIVLARRDRWVWADFWGRLWRFNRTDASYAALGAGVMLASILLAQVVSLFFGYGTDQFAFSGTASFSAGIAGGGVVLVVAPIIEELSWHSYGTDALRSRFSLWWTSIIFGVYWVVWHIPLGAVRGLYQAEVVESGWIYSVNFVVSLLPFVLLMNWLYYKANRSVAVAVVFHMSAGIFNEMFQTHPMSKVIQTGLLVCLTCWVIARDRRMFFERSTFD